MKRAAIGLRVSSEKQADEGFSLPSQMRRNVEFAQSLGIEYAVARCRKVTDRTTQ